MKCSFYLIYVNIVSWFRFLNSYKYFLIPLSKKYCLCSSTFKFLLNYIKKSETPYITMELKKNKVTPKYRLETLLINYWKDQWRFAFSNLRQFQYKWTFFNCSRTKDFTTHISYTTHLGHTLNHFGLHTSGMCGLPLVSTIFIFGRYNKGPKFL